MATYSNFVLFSNTNDGKENKRTETKRGERTNDKRRETK